MPKHAGAARPRLSVHLVIAGVAAGAAVSAFQFDVAAPVWLPGVGDGVQLAASMSGERHGQGGDNVSPRLLLAPRPGRNELEQITKSMRLIEQREAEARRKAEYEAEQARKIKVFAPTAGTVTSNFGPRWGTTHYGLDIANRIGTPIRSVMDGVVLEPDPRAGSGFGSACGTPTEAPLSTATSTAMRFVRGKG